MTNNPKPITSEKEAVEQLKKIITGIYLTGYDQGYHETHDDKDLKVFALFWDSSNPNTWKEQFEALIHEVFQSAYSQGEQGRAKEILWLLDKLEMDQPQDLKTDNWRNWKYIRNSIVDKYFSGEDKTK